MKRSGSLISFLTLFFLLLCARPAISTPVTVNGVEFAKTYSLENQTLSLRGAAMLRWAMMFDLYAGAFYLPKEVPARQWDRDVAKHLELCYFREISAKGFVESSQEHLQSTLPTDRLTDLQLRLNDLYGLFRDVGTKDRYALTYEPGVGTTLSLNGEPLGTIPGSDFARAYFGIWLGEAPLKKKFRDRLLGISGS